MKIADDLDMSCVSDISPTGTDAAGYRAFGESLARRLITPAGTLLDDDDYGLDVRQYLNSAHARASLRRISAQVSAEIVKDDRVASVDATVSFVGSSLVISCQVVGVTIDLAFTLKVSDVTVELLTEAA